MNTGIIVDNRYHEHLISYAHPENPKRLKAVYREIKDNSISARLLKIEPRLADREEIALIHKYSYIDEIESHPGKGQRMLDPDTYLSPKSPEIARLAVGGVLELIDRIVSGNIKNGFALIRPPGHHAENDRAMGFCIYNNIAVGAKYGIVKSGLERVAIIDWDLHHGNGTQHAFYDDPDILYFSIHQYPHYPGTGALSEKGSGKGEGFTINIPLSSGHRDTDYCIILDEIISPVCNEFQPQIILVSAGFDIYSMDPLGGMMVTINGFGAITSKIISIADIVCKGKVLYVMEGGYNIEGLAQGVIAVLDKMVKGEKDIEIPVKAPSPDIHNVIKRVKDIHKEYWRSLS